MRVGLASTFGETDRHFNGVDRKQDASTFATGLMK
jgi:hypothetical protein